MSIKDRIESEIHSQNEQDKENERVRERQEKEAKEFFAPVYNSFLEIEKEYGHEKGLLIRVSESNCSIKTEGQSRNSLKLSCHFFNRNEIAIEEVTDYGFITESELPSRDEKRMKVESAEEAIDLAIKYIGKHVKK
mgnify:CR=1 FL=1